MQPVRVSVRIILTVGMSKRTPSVGISTEIAFERAAWRRTYKRRVRYAPNRVQRVFSRFIRETGKSCLSSRRANKSRAAPPGKPVPRRPGTVCAPLAPAPQFTACRHINNTPRYFNRFAVARLRWSSVPDRTHTRTAAPYRVCRRLGAHFVPTPLPGKTRRQSLASGRKISSLVAGGTTVRLRSAGKMESPTGLSCKHLSIPRPRAVRPFWLFRIVS